MEKQLQDAEQEMEEMKERMKKCATSKDQKILELEEENDRLRAEAQPLGAKESMDALLSVKETRSKESEALMAEKNLLRGRSEAPRRGECTETS